MQLRHRLVAEAALGGVDDPLEGEVVGGLGDDAQISERVADLGALVEAEAADDPVGQADGDEPVLELAGLELGADQDRAVGELAAAMLDRLELVADPARLLGPVPDADHLDLVALVLPRSTSVLPSRPAFCAIRPGGGGEDVRGRAVILLEPDDLRARKILLEAQDVGDLGAAPGIDRLVVVADAADVLALLGEQAEPEILGLVGVLIFVDEDVSEALLVMLQHVAVGLAGSPACAAAGRRNRRR